jgi:hypothetical protein
MNQLIDLTLYEQILTNGGSNLHHHNPSIRELMYVNSRIEGYNTCTFYIPHIHLPQKRKTIFRVRRRSNNQS